MLLRFQTKSIGFVEYYWTTAMKHNFVAYRKAIAEKRISYVGSTF